MQGVYKSKWFWLKLPASTGINSIRHLRCQGSPTPMPRGPIFLLHLLAPSHQVSYMSGQNFEILDSQEIPSWHLPLCCAVLFSKLLLNYCVEIRVLSQFSIIFRARISDMTKQNNFYVSLLPLSHLNLFLMYLLLRSHQAVSSIGRGLWLRDRLD